jgi:hypothetical protein
MPFVQGSKCCEQQEQHTVVSVMNHRILKILEGKPTSSSMNDTKKTGPGKVSPMARDTEKAAQL